MRDRWYGDNRDLIKWGGIKILCNENKINKVLWVAYLREDTWAKIIFDNGFKTKSVPRGVVNHFKSIRKNLERLRNDLDLDIVLVDNEFNVTYDRKNSPIYTGLICNCIENNFDKKKIVFLDPDTGLQPKRISETTVAKKDVKRIWDILNEGDYLVFYQHKFFDKEWVNKRKKELADSCGLPNDKDVKTWCSEKSIENNSAKLANDVVFYFIKK